MGEDVLCLVVSWLIYILIALVTNVVVARRGFGGMAWFCVVLVVVAASATVLSLQAMVPDSWSLGLWIVGILSLVVMVIPLPLFGKFGAVVKILLALIVFAYPVWLGSQMALVYVAIQSDDTKKAYERVDFEAMRGGVERQLVAHFEAVDASLASRKPEGEGLVAGVKSMFSSGARMSRRWLVKKVARNILTPEGLKKVLEQQPGDTSSPGPAWNERLQIESVNRWRLWTNAGWVGFEPSERGDQIQLRTIEFSQDVLNQIEQIEERVD